MSSSQAQAGCMAGGGGGGEGDGGSTTSSQQQQQQQPQLLHSASGGQGMNTNTNTSGGNNQLEVEGHGEEEEADEEEEDEEDFGDEDDDDLNDEYFDIEDHELVDMLDEEGEDDEEEEEYDDEGGIQFTFGGRSIVDGEQELPPHIMRLLRGFASLREQRPRVDPRRFLVPGAEEVPSREGLELMKGGDFGAEELGAFPRKATHTQQHQQQKGRSRKKQRLAARLLQREIGTYRGEKARIGSQLLAQSLIPTSSAEFIMNYSFNVYSGQFSTDGNFFYSCSQNFKVRMYDTSNPYDWEHYKTVEYYDGSWTITDATLSPDNKMLAYSSIAPVVYVSNTSQTSGEEGTWAMDFMNSRAWHRFGRGFGIWSIRFSGDGRELVAGASDSNLYIYDIETQTPILKLTGHKDEVNAVCFADVSSPHILYSGSDDTTLKVWDRRSMASGREAGVFAGHLEGLTYIDSKGDGRYVLSNSKDQTMKLWDIRKMMEPSAFDNLTYKNYSCGFDYRGEPYAYPPARHPADCSVVTYRGHSVLRTLIRCHFSPPVSTGSRYVYTGSADGKVWVYNLDATVAAVIDVKSEVAGAYNLSPSERRGTCVRDASWHPNAGVLAATSWAGQSRDIGSVTLHTTGGGGVGDDGGRLLDCEGRRCRLEDVMRRPRYY